MKHKVLAVFFVFAVFAGVHGQSRLAMPNNPNAAAKTGQSEIHFNTGGADRDIAVWVNGTIVAHVPPKTTEKIIVPNGRTVIEAADTVYKNGQWVIGAKKQAAIDTVPGTPITVGFTTRYGALLSLNVQGGIAVAAVPAPAASSAPAPSTAAPSKSSQPAREPSRGIRARVEDALKGRGIEGAVNRAATALAGKLPNGATIAILSMASSDADLSDFVIEELIFLMVDTGKFKVVDRKSLDLLKTELRFQYSGDVDDKSAVSIGKMLGASIVITGSISGSGSTKRLRAKALDVKTAQIMAAESESF